MKGYLLYSKSLDLNVNYILKIRSQPTSRLVSDKTAEHHSLAKLTQKINYYTHHGDSPRSLSKMQVCLEVRLRDMHF